MENKFKTAFIKVVAVFAVVVIAICAAPVASLSGLDGGTVAVASAAEISGIYTYIVDDKEAVITEISEEATGAIKIPSKLGGYPVTVIDESACSFNFSITSITIPDSVKEIRYSAFSYCPSLKSVTVGKGVKKIEGNPFDSCEALKTVKISKNNPYFTNDANGVVFDKSMTKLILCPAAAAIFNYTVPNTVKTIGESAFASNCYLSSITLPSSVKAVYENAFWYCSKLKTVNASDSLYKVGAEAFSETPYFNAVQNDVVYVGKVACGFSGEKTPSKITVKDGTKGIAECAFSLIEGIEEIYIPDSVIYIGGSAFGTEIEKITVGENNTKFMSDINGVLYSKDMKTLIAYPAARMALKYTVSDKTEKIGEGAFSFSTYLEEVTLPSSVKTLDDTAFSFSQRLTKVNMSKNITELGQAAFAFCTSLESIRIPDGVTTVPSSAFSWCASLQTVKFGKNVTKISYGAFLYCNALQKITLPESLKIIEEGAFSNCTSLKSVTIGKNVKSIKGNPFSSCTGIKYFKVASGNKYFSVDSYGTLMNKSGTKLIAYPAARTSSAYSVPKTVTVIGDEAFLSCNNLKKVSVAEKTKTVGSMAFAYCEKLETVSLPRVSTINESAFYFCDKLENVYLSSSLKNVGDSAFDSCESIEDIYYGGTKAEWKKINFAEYNDAVKGADKHYSHRHTYNKGKVASKATYLKDGYKLYTCTECNGIKTTVTDKLRLAKTSAKTLKSTKARSAVITWAPVKDATGYIVTYSTSKDFASSKTKKTTVKNAEANKTTLKKLTSGKKYYVKVRAYKVVDGTTVYGSYSNVMSVKVK